MEQVLAGTRWQSKRRLRTQHAPRSVELRIREERARADERRRIARILHDDLLQGVLALSLQVQAGVAQLPTGHPVRLRVESTLDWADQLVEAVRLAVGDCRASRPRSELSRALFSELSGAAAVWDSPAELRVLRVGCPRRLRPAVAAEMFAIAREAALNAMRHSGATRIEVRVSYLSSAVAVSIFDNGRGLAAVDARKRGTDASWGLIGMQERADVIGAVLLMRSAAGRGTQVRVELPGERAYQETEQAGPSLRVMPPSERPQTFAFREFHD